MSEILLEEQFAIDKLTGDMTEKERHFVFAYAKTRNGTEAAELAGYNTDDRMVLGAIASELLKKPKVQQALKAISRMVILDTDSALKKLSDYIHADITDFINIYTGEMKPEKEWQHLSHLVRDFEMEEWWDDKGNRHIKRKIKVHDSFQAVKEFLKLTMPQKRLNVDIDLNRLSTEQLARLAEGEDIIEILLDSNERKVIDGKTSG